MKALVWLGGGSLMVWALYSALCVAVVTPQYVAPVVIEAAQPIPPQPTVVVPAPVVNWGGPSVILLTETGVTTILLADVGTMTIPVGAMLPSEHARIKHTQKEVDRVHARLLELPAAYIARYKRPCRDGLVRIPVPFEETNEYGLEVLLPIAEGLYQERTAFIAARGWDYIREVLDDCRNGQGGAAIAQ